MTTELSEAARGAMVLIDFIVTHPDKHGTRRYVGNRVWRQRYADEFTVGLGTAEALEVRRYANSRGFPDVAAVAQAAE